MLSNRNSLLIWVGLVRRAVVASEARQFSSTAQVKVLRARRSMEDLKPLSESRSCRTSVTKSGSSEQMEQRDHVEMYNQEGLVTENTCRVTHKYIDSAQTH